MRKGLSFKEGYGLTEAGPNNFYMDQSKVKEKRRFCWKTNVVQFYKINERRWNRDGA